MLQKHRDQLNKKRDFYNDRISRWCNRLNKDYEDGKKLCTIEIPLYGPDVYYDNDERELLNRALNNLLWTLGSKGYSYTSNEREEKYNDCMDGSCLIGTTILTIQY
ncbi:Hypothetical protein ORPV_1098 [Orpheovirus IHUMI-LCC2]|uniref:Uncharacterized protein n=1 Tax=Orpheovirus IHUMI-LCC2 TaxID=2023057 RepID=A0A2I2L630_9VIRU|nr:Hypothetical protein ORPV_1098 [Orpheovirus IHUMI-LCC2]SNW63002.1 Hypothetical protein ORPV_1098 [Orpheovirus IHUMI-LCC2]